MPRKRSVTRGFWDKGKQFRGYLVGAFGNQMAIYDDFLCKLVGGVCPQMQYGLRKPRCLIPASAQRTGWFFAYCWFITTTSLLPLYLILANGKKVSWQVVYIWIPLMVTVIVKYSSVLTLQTHILSPSPFIVLCVYFPLKSYDHQSDSLLMSSDLQSYYSITLPHP